METIEQKAIDYTKDKYCRICRLTNERSDCDALCKGAESFKEVFIAGANSRQDEIDKLIKALQDCTEWMGLWIGYLKIKETQGDKMLLEAHKEARELLKKYEL